MESMPVYVNWLECWNAYRKIQLKWLIEVFDWVLPNWNSNQYLAMFEHQALNTIEVFLIEEI